MPKYTSADLENALAELNKVGKFKASVITAESGFLIACSIEGGADEDLVAAIGPAIHSIVIQSTNNIKLGKPKDIVIRSEKGYLVVKALGIKSGAEYILAIISQSGANWMDEDVLNTINKIRDILDNLGLT